MPVIQTRTLPPSKDAGDSHSDEHRDQWVREQNMVAQVLDLPKHVAWDGGYELTELKITAVDGGWLVVVKAIRNRKPYVAFLNAASYAEALFYVGEWAYEARFMWKVDKWPSKHTRDVLGMS